MVSSWHSSTGCLAALAACPLLSAWAWLCGPAHTGVIDDFEGEPKWSFINNQNGGLEAEVIDGQLVVSGPSSWEANGAAALLYLPYILQYPVRNGETFELRVDVVSANDRNLFVALYLEFDVGTADDNGLLGYICWRSRRQMAINKWDGLREIDSTLVNQWEGLPDWTEPVVSAAERKAPPPGALQDLRSGTHR